MSKPSELLVSFLNNHLKVCNSIKILTANWGFQRKKKKRFAKISHIFRSRKLSCFCKISLQSVFRKKSKNFAKNAKSLRKFIKKDKILYYKIIREMRNFHENIFREKVCKIRTKIFAFFAFFANCFVR